MNRRLECNYWVFLGVMAVTGCHNSPPPALLTPSHPLIGQIWNSGTNAFYRDSDHLIESLLSTTDLFLVGEIHDNSVHREIQHLLQRKLAPGAIGFEALNHEDQPHLDSFSSAEELMIALNWDKRGWGQWDSFLRFFESAKKTGTKLVGLNLNKKLIKNVAFKGLNSLPAHLLAKLQLETTAFLSPSQVESLTTQIQESHCGMLDKSMAAKMLPAQQVRDAVMAWTLGHQNSEKKLLAFVGNEHARSDRGIPPYLKIYNPKIRLISIHLVEVVREKTKPEDYWSNGREPSIIWFTQKQERKDPCEKYRQAMKKHRSPTQSNKDSLPSK